MFISGVPRVAVAAGLGVAGLGAIGALLGGGGDDGNSESASGATARHGSSSGEPDGELPDKARAIDVSMWQGGIDWKRAKHAGQVDIAYVKATEGATETDATFQRNVRGAQKADVVVGAYHFARPEGGDAIAEADHFVDSLNKSSLANDDDLAEGTLRPVLDLEDAGPLDRRKLGAWVDTWTSRVEERTGVEPVIYASPSFWEDRVGQRKDLADHPLWVAHYGTDRPDVPSTWQSWQGWQYTSTGRVPGVKGDVDVNTFRKPEDIVVD